MSLNLKNPRAHELAAELAEMTGESLTTAVIKALEERIRAVRQTEQKSKSELILEFADRFARTMPAGCRSSDHATLLYDEDGLPK